MKTIEQQVVAQRDYYTATATSYEAMHRDQDHEHAFSLAFLLGMLDHYGAKSVLDVGAGTGNAIRCMAAAKPDVHVVGVEPVAALREQGYLNGVPREILLDGDGSKLNFADGAFDLVCEFAVLHHVKRPDVMVREMLRVARRAVFISDCNNFGQGSPFSRTVKQLLRAMRLWPVANWLKSGRKGYYISEGDGLFYSYSVFDAYPILREQCDLIHIVNTSAGGPGIYRSCGHAALLAIKR